MKNFSCSYSRLYERGGYYESSQTAEALIDIGDECRWVAPLYPPYAYDRPQPQHLLSRDARFTVDLFDQYRDRNATYTRGSSTDLFVLEKRLALQPIAV